MNKDELQKSQEVMSDEISQKNPKKRRKLQQSAAPSREELQQLQERKSKFHSSLFQMQVVELLKEIQVENKKKQCIDKYINMLSAELCQFPEGKEYILSTGKVFQDLTTKCPISFSPEEMKGAFKFVPPSDVRTIGSYQTDTLVKPDINIDLAVQIPQSCLEAKDNLNLQYVRKRSLYLAFLAEKLQNSNLISDIQYKHDNRKQPVLFIIPHEQFLKNAVVNMHLLLPGDMFKMSRLNINKNNIHKSWYHRHFTESKDVQVDDISCKPQTPHYNTAVLQDMIASSHTVELTTLLEDSEGLKHGLMLLKVWLRQRELHKGYGGFSSFIMSMLIMYLVRKKRLNKVMTSYQVFSNTLLYLAQANWKEEGITLHLHRGDDKGIPELSDFHKNFDVVFVDTSGFVNLCSAMNACLFDRVKLEASKGLHFLENDGIDAFDNLFMQHMPFLHTFDTIVQITVKFSEVKTLCEHFNLSNQVMDLCGDYCTACLPRLHKLVKKALGNRVNLLQIQPNSSIKWKINEEAKSQSKLRIIFGLILNRDTASSVIDRGPPADSPEAKEFQRFWGNKSELRRFQDGSLCEAILWPCNTIADRRKIITKIIKHILCTHAGIQKENIHCCGNDLMNLLRLPARDAHLSLGTGEELNVRIHHAFDKLSKQLRGLKDLPLAITSVQGLHPVFRDAEVFPPMFPSSTRGTVKQVNSLLPLPGKNCPEYYPSLTVLCMLENSGKWPEDSEAILRMKTAFYIQLGKILHDSYGILKEIYATHLIVLEDGVAFKIKIGYMREITLSKMQKNSRNLVKLVENETSVKLQQDLVIIPRLTSTLYGLQQQNNSYSGAVRLSKRWLASQLLTDHIPCEAVELLVAKFFIKPDPYCVPCSAIVAFLRWLDFMATHNWATTPVIVNLNNELQNSDMDEIYSHFTKNRATLPHAFIATPVDRLSSITRKSPSIPILNRLSVLAKESHYTLSNQLASPYSSHDIKQIFRPSLDIYDLLIVLNQNQVPRMHESVDVTMGTKIPIQCADGQNKRDGQKQVHVIPVIDYDPVQIYLKQLKETFGDLALFFHDPHGGTFIAVLWKPCVEQPHEFKVSHLGARMPSSVETQTVFNKEAIVEDFMIMGKGIVSTIKLISTNNEHDEDT